MKKGYTIAGIGLLALIDSLPIEKKPAPRYCCKKCHEPTRIVYNGKCEKCEFENDRPVKR